MDMKRFNEPEDLPKGGLNMGFMIAVFIVLFVFLGIFLTMYFRYHK